MSADAVAATLVAQEADVRARLDQFIRLPSVSTDPAYAEGMRGAQQFLFKELLGIETLMFGFGLPDEDVHAPNEFFRLASLPLGLRGWVMLLDELAAFAPATFVIPTRQ